MRNELTFADSSLSLLPSPPRAALAPLRQPRQATVAGGSSAAPEKTRASLDSLTSSGTCADLATVEFRTVTQAAAKSRTTNRPLADDAERSRRRRQVAIYVRQVDASAGSTPFAGRGSLAAQPAAAALTLPSVAPAASVPAAPAYNFYYYHGQPDHLPRRGTLTDAQLFRLLPILPESAPEPTPTRPQTPAPTSAFSDWGTSDEDAASRTTPNSGAFAAPAAANTAPAPLPLASVPAAPRLADDLALAVPTHHADDATSTLPSRATSLFDRSRATTGEDAFGVVTSGRHPRDWTAATSLLDHDFAVVLQGVAAAVGAGDDAAGRSRDGHSFFERNEACASPSGSLASAADIVAFYMGAQ